MKTEIQTITPDLAHKYLALNISNRPMRESHAKALSLAILRGEWKLSPQPIVLSKGGILLDGQHRLRAIILANTSIEMSVTTGVSENVFDVLDTGKNRNFADVSGLSTKEASIATALSWLTYITKPTHQQTQEVYSVYEKEVTRFCENALKANMRITSASYFKAGIIYQSFRNNNIDECINIYNNLISMGFDKLPKIAQSYLRLHSRKMNSSNSIIFNRRDRFNIASIVFNSENSNKAQIKYNLCEDHLYFRKLTLGRIHVLNK